jgi:hypothetical protein
MRLQHILQEKMLLLCDMLSSGSTSTKISLTDGRNHILNVKAGISIMSSSEAVLELIDPGIRLARDSTNTIPSQLDGPFLESQQKVKARRGSLFCSLNPMRGTLMVQALKRWISDFGQYWLTEQIP